MTKKYDEVDGVIIKVNYDTQVLQNEVSELFGNLNVPDLIFDLSYIVDSEKLIVLFHKLNEELKRQKNEMDSFKEENTSSFPCEFNYKLLPYGVQFNFKENKKPNSQPLRKELETEDCND